MLVANHVIEETQYSCTFQVSQYHITPTSRLRMADPHIGVVDTSLTCLLTYRLLLRTLVTLTTIERAIKSLFHLKYAMLTIYQHSVQTKTRQSSTRKLFFLVVHNKN